MPSPLVTVDNVTVRDSATAGIYTSASSPLITNCVVENNVGDGFRLNGAGVADINGCVIDGNGLSGIRAISGNTAPVIADNEITNNGDWGINARGRAGHRCTGCRADD